MDETSTIEPISNPVLSKTQAKKQQRWEKKKQKFVENRKLERQKKKDKRQKLAKAIIDSGGTAEDVSQALSSRKYNLMANSKCVFKVVIDMDFEEYMSTSELSKAVQQVARIYSLNRHATNPIQLYVTSLKNKVQEKFSTTNTGYLSWDINISEKKYLDLFNDGEGDEQAQDNFLDKFIYLTGDSDNVLPDVDKILEDKSKIYVIGGLVDHNRHKSLCKRLAEEKGIKTAKLPIKDNVKLNDRHILSTVAVFEILLKVLGSQEDWQSSLVSSIPRRKIVED